MIVRGSAPPRGNRLHFPLRPRSNGSRAKHSAKAVFASSEKRSPPLNYLNRLPACPSVPSHQCRKHPLIGKSLVVSDVLHEMLRQVCETEGASTIVFSMDKRVRPCRLDGDGDG